MGLSLKTGLVSSKRTGGLAGNSDDIHTRQIVNERYVPENCDYITNSAWLQDITYVHINYICTYKKRKIMDTVVHKT